MKKVLFVLLLVVVVVGFFRGWFVLTSNSRDEDNKVNVNLTVDPDKVKEDAEKVQDKATGLGERTGDTVKQDGQ